AGAGHDRAVRGDPVRGRGPARPPAGGDPAPAATRERGSTVTGFPTALVRPDLRDFAGYSSARTSATVPATIWLNANESAGPSLVDPEGRVRRYPEPQPPE